MARNKNNDNSGMPTNGKWGHNIFWTLDSENVLRIDGEGVLNEPMWTNEQRNIPGKIIIGEGITELERSALYNFRHVTEIILPSTVTSMGKAVFEDCRSLEKVNIPKSLTVIPSFTFFCCHSLKEINIPLNITMINYGAFMNCFALEKIEIPYTVTRISDNVFRECKELTIYGYANTFAQLYASACNVPFIEIEDDTDHSLFPDISADESNAYFKAVYWAVSKNIIKGRKDGTLVPTELCSRGQFAIMMWRYAGRPKDNEPTTFSDVPPERNDFRAISWTQRSGITEGFSDGTFRPYDTITREHICKMLWCWAGKPEAAGNIEFSDLSPEDEYYVPVAWAVENNLLKTAEDHETRKITLHGNTCQRQLAADMLYNFAKNIRGDNI